MKATRSSLVFWALLLTVLLAAGQPLASPNRPRQLVVAYNTDVTSLDPHDTSDTNTTAVRMSIYNGLLRMDGNRNLVPDLAESWIVSNDNLTYTFKLRRGVKFHDGTDFDAFAVKASFDRLQARSRSPVYGQLRQWAKTQVIDKYTVALSTEKPFGPFLGILSQFGHIPSPAAVSKYGDDLAVNPVGTGPYKFVEWKRGEQVVLEAFQGYFERRPSFERIVYKIVREAAPRVLMLETGEAQFAMRIPPEDVARLQSNPNLKIVGSDTGRVAYVLIRTDKPPLTDRRVRQALNYAINKKEIVTALFGGDWKLARNIVCDICLGYSPVASYPYDPARAKRLLAEAGYPNGFRVTMWSPLGAYVKDAEISQIIQAQLARIGVQVDLQIIGDFPTYNSRFFTDQGPDLVYIAWASNSMDAHHFLSLLFHSANAGKPFNASRYKNSRVDSLIERGQETVDPVERRKIYEEATRIILEDAPLILLFQQRAHYGMHKDLTDVIMLPTEHVVFRYAKLK